VVCERLVLSEKMAPRTLSDYRSKTRNWISPLLGKHRLDRLTPEHLDAAYAVMLREEGSHLLQASLPGRLQCSCRQVPAASWRGRRLSAT
jgi:hypothetical protein